MSDQIHKLFSSIIDQIFSSCYYYFMHNVNIIKIIANLASSCVQTTFNI